MPPACQPLSRPPDDLLPFKFTSVSACFPLHRKKRWCRFLSGSCTPAFSSCHFIFLFPALKKLTFLIIADCRFRKLHVAMENMA